MISLVDLYNEIKVTSLAQIEKLIPKEWTKEEITDEDQDNELYGSKIIEYYSAPMEGWDEEHLDIIKIIQTPENKFKIDVYISYGEYEENEKIFNSLLEAKLGAIEIMKDIMSDWDDEGFENEIDEVSTTGGGVAGATFTPGVGEQYATPYAFGKKKKKSYEVGGYKSLNPKQRFKAKTFDVVNWKSNKPHYLKEIKVIFKITPEMVDKLDKEIMHNSLNKSNKHQQEYMFIRGQYGNGNWDLEKGMMKWKKEDLIGLFKDILNFKQKYNL